ncbi:MAG TPA: ketoacyl-ACP synthase III [Alphaproteobacteria bacterium]|nr:ketoacyl-ACP synthase III [Alphaproteobacteria bacterium]
MSGEHRIAYVAGTGHYVPDRLVHNVELFEFPGIRETFDTERARASLRSVDPEAADSLSDAEIFDGWARQLTGIGSRRLLSESDDTTVEDMCVVASRRALEAAGLSPAGVDFVVVASLTAREIVPNISISVGARLGIPSVAGFVLNTACAGFLHGLSVGWTYLRTGQARNVLIVSGDALSRITNYRDPKTAVLFADGAGALVLTTEPGRGRVLGPPFLAAEYSPDHLNLVGQGWADEGPSAHKLRMAGGPNVLRHAIRTMREAADVALERSGVAWNEVDAVVPHQANGRITLGLERSLKLERGRVIHAIDGLGNVSASSVPITLDRLLRGEHGPLPESARIVLTAVGGGYASGAAVLEWCGGAGGNGAG